MATHHPPPFLQPSDVVKLERAMGQVLLRAEACLNSASARGKIQESPDLASGALSR